MVDPSFNPQGTSFTLIERARARDEGAWTRIILLYTPLVRSWCFRSGLQENDTDDLVQEVFRAALAGLDDFHRDRPGDTFRGWLRVITRNSLALHFRRKVRAPAASGGSEAFSKLLEVSDPHVNLPTDDSPSELQELYRRALELVRAEFEDRTWQMFWLTVVDDRAPADVAAIFGVTPVAVRKAKSRVLHRLRTEIGDLIT
jgi:RNA polymerase sigma-70 factor, ECF subfamily